MSRKEDAFHRSLGKVKLVDTKNWIEDDFQNAKQKRNSYLRQIKQRIGL